MAHCRFHPFKQWEYDIVQPTLNWSRKSAGFSPVFRREIERDQAVQVKKSSFSPEISFSRASLTVCFRPQSSITNLPSGSSLRSRDWDLSRKTGHVRKAKEKMMKTMVSMDSFLSLPDLRNRKNQKAQPSKIWVPFLGTMKLTQTTTKSSQLVSSESSEKCIETTIQQYSVYRHTPNVPAK